MMERFFRGHLQLPDARTRGVGSAGGVRSPTSTRKSPPHPPIRPPRLVGPPRLTPLCLHTQYTMNVDGLHRLVDGMSDVVRAEDCPGKTVELHGCCREIVCTNESCPKQASDEAVEQGKAFRGARRRAMRGARVQ